MRGKLDIAIKSIQPLLVAVEIRSCALPSAVGWVRIQTNETLPPLLAHHLAAVLSRFGKMAHLPIERRVNACEAIEPVP